MGTSFNFDEIKTVEFGVCLDTEGGDEEYFLIPVDVGVKTALGEMLGNTLKQLALHEDDVEEYEPSQKYGTIERLKLSLDDVMLEKVRQLNSAENIETNVVKIRETQDMAFYFALFRDAKKNKLIGVRRAPNFKGIVKAKNRLIQIIDETLRMVDDDIFKLDLDFDYLVFNNTAFILRPSGFEYTAAIDSYILEKATQSVGHVARAIPFLDLRQLAEYVSSHKRAARLVASIKARRNINRTSRKRLSQECRKFGIELVREEDKWRPANGHEVEFLKLLDRRLYDCSLTDEENELFEAANRKEIRPTVQPRR